MSNVCRTASAREKSRERMTIIAVSQPLRGGQQAPAFQVAKMASKKPQRQENNPEASASSQQSVQEHLWPFDVAPRATAFRMRAEQRVQERSRDLRV